MEKELDKYGDLLSRPEWWAARMIVALGAGYKCEKCGKYLPMRNERPTGEVHHTKYTAEYPWLEPLENMHYLCHDCHEEIHGRAFGWMQGYRHTVTCDSAVCEAYKLLIQKSNKTL